MGKVIMYKHFRKKIHRRKENCSLHARRPALVASELGLATACSHYDLTKAAAPRPPPIVVALHPSARGALLSLSLRLRLLLLRTLSRRHRRMLRLVRLLLLSLRLLKLVHHRACLRRRHGLLLALLRLGLMRRRQHRHLPVHLHPGHLHVARRVAHVVRRRPLLQ